ncbi:ROK family transcriptional regulator [Alloscardovia criceti]|uniref:ROK family transcriptional regulator n=1 Tax=Alloscardovia criceti TaxID=356828 RepID=UPI0003714A2F|nr:ROK family transcriptional regulator [Alloscardovia criceti]
MPRHKALNQENLRAHNIGVVLSAILHSREPVSRAHIARTTGMTKAAISIIVSDLISHKILKEGKPQQLASTGKPSNPLEFVEGSWLGLGVQVHTDGYGFMLQDFNGKIHARQWVNTMDDSSDADTILSQLVSMIDPIVHDFTSKGVHILGGGLAVPGMVTNDGILVDAPNLGWKNLNLMETELVKKYALTPHNEANLAAIAQIPGYAVSCTANEQRENSYLPEDSFIYISSDVGIGGAYIDHGALVTGTWGVAGEIGHLSVSMGGPVCRCGRRGCMEMYAGRKALLNAAGCENAAALDADESFTWLSQKLVGSDPKASDVMSEATRAMASAIVSTVNILDITKIIIGGFWTRFGTNWLNDLYTSVNTQLNAVHKDKLEIVFPTVDQYAGVYGAAEFGLRKLIDNAAEYLQ